MGFKSQEDNKHSFDVATDQNTFLLSQDVSAYRDYAKESRTSMMPQVQRVTTDPLQLYQI